MVWRFVYRMMRTGRVDDDFVSRESADAIHLIAGERDEIRLPRAVIEMIGPGRVSVMSQGLDVQMTGQQLADAIAFLQSLK